jgi:hypothetical protein
VRAAARPEMEWLRDQVGETVNLTVRQGDEMVYVERVTPNRMMRVEQVVGSRAPLHVTAVGKLMLGEIGAAAIRDYAKRTRLPGLHRQHPGRHCKACWRTWASAPRAATPWTTRIGALVRNWAWPGCIGAVWWASRDASASARRWLIGTCRCSAPMERRTLPAAMPCC